MILSRFKTTFAVIVGALMVSSCGPLVQMFNVDVKVPAKHPLELSGKSIAVFSQIDGVNDSLLMVKLAAALSAEMERELTYKVGSIPAFNLHSDTSDIWDTGYIQSLSLKSNADILMVIKNLDIKQPVMSGSDRLPSGGNYASSYVLVPFTTLVDIYDGITADKLTSLFQSDTLLWEVLFRSDLKEAAITARIHKSLLEATKNIAENISGNFFDQWTTVQRYLYVYDNNKWHQAYNQAQKFNWDQAMQIWLAETGTSDRLMSACAAFNLAIACEMKSRRELALEWLQFAESCYQLKGIEEYKSILKK